MNNATIRTNIRIAKISIHITQFLDVFDFLGRFGLRNKDCASGCFAVDVIIIPGGVLPFLLMVLLQPLGSVVRRLPLEWPFNGIVKEVLGILAGRSPSSGLECACLLVYIGPGQIPESKLE